MVTSPRPDFLEVANLYRAEVDAALDRVTQYDQDCPVRLAEAVRYSLLSPGKRLRPLLVLMSARACGSDWQEAIPAACAVEMIHTYSLIHDDLPCMDDDDMRRGRASSHIVFGEGLATLAGDALLTQAFEVLSGLRPEVVGRALSELAKAAGASGMVGGQVDDLDAEFSVGSVEQLERIHRRKTGAMFRVSLRLGGIVASAGTEQLTALDTYGTKLGLAFQVVDDLLDELGDESQLGKRTGKDSEHGKLTYPKLLGHDESRRYAQQLIDEACDNVMIFGELADELTTLARFVIERKT